MSKVEIKTLYVDKSQIEAIEEANRGKGFNVLPIGEPFELIPGITIYEIPNMEKQTLTEEQNTILNEEHNKTEPEIMTAPTFEKVYMSEEHRKKSEGS